MSTDKELNQSEELTGSTPQVASADEASSKAATPRV